jgi:hypothetical protein
MVLVRNPERGQMGTELKKKTHELKEELLSSMVRMNEHPKSLKI